MKGENSQIKEILANLQEDCKKLKRTNYELQESLDNMNDRIKSKESYENLLEGKAKMNKANFEEIEKLKIILNQEQQNYDAKVNDFLNKINNLNNEIFTLQKTNDNLFNEKSRIIFL